MPADARVEALARALAGGHREVQWHGEFEGYTVNFIAKNLWRVAGTMEFDDVLHEAVLVFLRVRAKYPGVEPKHLMALYQTSWGRRFTDLSNEDTARRSEDGSVALEAVGSMDNDGYLATLLRQAPSEVRMVLSLLLNAPQDLLASLLHGKDNPDARTHHNGSKRVNELLGLPIEQDTMGMVRSYFE